MAKAKFEIKIDLKNEATKGLHAGVGVVDLAVETVKEYAADAQKRIEGVQKDAQKRLAEVQKSVKGLEFEPKALRSQATKEAAARRDLVEKRVAALQADAQKFVTTNVESATDTYDDLAKRGATVVRRFRNKPATKATVANAKTTQAKAKTTATQAKKTAKKSPAKSSAKATGTAAKKTVKSAAQAAS